VRAPTIDGNLRERASVAKTQATSDPTVSEDETNTDVRQ
jgi:hypothetical protein